MGSSREQIAAELGQDVFVAATAYVGGAVTIGDQCTIMHHVSIRGDVGRIIIGKRVNIQDGSVLHTNSGDDLLIEDDVSIGHRAVVHCRKVGTRSLIGIGAIVLDDCVVGAGSIVAAGAVVTPGTVIELETVVMGVPAKPIRRVTDRERAYCAAVVANYIELGKQHAAGRFPDCSERG